RALVLGSAGLGPPAQVLLLILAGAGEGTLLGLGQAYALRCALPSVPTRAWVRATATGAAVAWAIGSVPVLLGEGMPVVPWPLLAVMGAVTGTTLAGLVGLLGLVGTGPRFRWRGTAGPTE
ncbi:hypothetical protein, partial [Planomonospora algeriensis]